MIELLAFAAESGWAFLRHQGALKVLRPPYQNSNLLAIDEATLRRALQDHGFVACRESFASWAALITSLETRLVAERAARGRSQPETRAIRQLVHRAPESVLRRYLDRIENELLPGREKQAAFELLTQLLAVETVKQKTELYDRALELLARWRAESSLSTSELIDEAEALRQQFPRAVARYGVEDLLGFTESVSRRRQIFAFGT